MSIIKKNLFSENTNQLSMFPDYSKRVAQSFNVDYIAPCDGWLLINYSCYKSASGPNPNIVINGVSVNSHPGESFGNRYTIDGTYIFPIKNFSTYKVIATAVNASDHVWFIPLDLSAQIPTTSDIYFPNTLIQQWNSYCCWDYNVQSGVDSVVVKSYVDEEGNTIDSECYCDSAEATGTIHMSYIKFANGQVNAQFITDITGRPYNTGHTGINDPTGWHYWFNVFIPLSNIKGIILNNNSKPITIAFAKTDSSSSGFNSSAGRYNDWIRMCSSYRDSSSYESSTTYLYRYTINVTGYWQ